MTPFMSSNVIFHFTAYQPFQFHTDVCPLWMIKEQENYSQLELHNYNNNIIKAWPQFLILFCFLFDSKSNSRASIFSLKKLVYGTKKAIIMMHTCRKYTYNILSYSEKSILIFLCVKTSKRFLFAPGNIWLYCCSLVGEPKRTNWVEYGIWNFVLLLPFLKYHKSSEGSDKIF